MDSYSPPGRGTGRVADRFEDVIDRIEFEVKHAVQYVNDAVVPQVRAESIQALRTLGETLQKLAERMDKPRGPQA